MILTWELHVGRRIAKTSPHQEQGHAVSTNKTPAQLDREIATIASGHRVSQNTDGLYKSVVPNLGKLSQEPQRFVGKCKRCGSTHQVRGLMRSATTTSGNGEFVVETPSGRLFATAHFGTDASNLYVRCGDHHVLLRRVVEG